MHSSKRQRVAICPITSSGGIVAARSGSAGGLDSYVDNVVRRFERDAAHDRSECSAPRRPRNVMILFVAPCVSFAEAVACLHARRRWLDEQHVLVSRFGFHRVASNMVFGGVADDGLVAASMASFRKPELLHAILEYIADDGAVDAVLLIHRLKRVVHMTFLALRLRKRLPAPIVRVILDWTGIRNAFDCLKPLCV